ncbi:hypothetical protein BEST7613_1487 [Synechocystis sp. PCC 6803]|nr:hypothetical protein BEST7613_1487 [Synechocystis sp. PCC 6803] [Bacillus subtilis BEST7613]
MRSNTSPAQLGKLAAPLSNTDKAKQANFFIGQLLAPISQDYGGGNEVSINWGHKPQRPMALINGTLEKES